MTDEPPRDGATGDAADRARRLAEGLSELLNRAGYIFLKGDKLSPAEARQLEKLADTVLTDFRRGGVYQTGFDLKRIEASLDLWCAALRHPTRDGLPEASKGLLQAMDFPIDQLVLPDGEA